MKLRIKIDVIILVFIVVFTGFIYLYAPGLYSSGSAFNNVSDFFGVIMILKGNLLRMWARGHKKAFSANSGQLVTTGPYTLTRNPMYEGTFLMGTGFILVAWPWWILPFFACVFYLRFKQQVAKEEAALTKYFGQEYKHYCQKTPRLFPDIRQLMKADWSLIFDWQEALSTKEAQGLIIWPLAAFFFDCIQERIIFGYIDIKSMIIVFISACFVFAAGCLIFLRKK